MLTPEKGERNLWFLSVGVYHSIPASLSRTFQAFQQPISPSAPLSVFVRAPLSFAPHRWSQHRIKWKHGSSYGSKKNHRMKEEWTSNERMKEWNNSMVFVHLFQQTSMIIYDYRTFYLLLWWSQLCRPTEPHRICHPLRLPARRVRSDSNFSWCSRFILRSIKARRYF